jgi:hypothetical protein
MRRVSVKGVLIGGIVDIVSTNILAIVLFGIGWAILIPRMPHMDSRSAIQVLMANPGMLAAQSVAGALCSIFGGYVAARLAKHDELLNGALSAFLCVSSGVIELATMSNHDRLLLGILMLPISPCLGLLGGYLQRARRRRIAATAV